MTLIAYQNKLNNAKTLLFFAQTLLLILPLFWSLDFFQLQIFRYFGFIFLPSWEGTVSMVDITFNKDMFMSNKLLPTNLRKNQIMHIVKTRQLILIKKRRNNAPGVLLGAIYMRETGIIVKSCWLQMEPTPLIINRFFPLLEKSKSKILTKSYSISFTHCSQQLLYCFLYSQANQQTIFRAINDFCFLFRVKTNPLTRWV